MDEEREKRLSEKRWREAGFFPTRFALYMNGCLIPEGVEAETFPVIRELILEYLFQRQMMEWNEEAKTEAWRAVQAAVAAGRIKRVEGKVFHHPDYSRPLYGCWVTPAEHKAIHAGKLACPECLDYAFDNPVATK